MTTVRGTVTGPGTVTVDGVPHTVLTTWPLPTPGTVVTVMHVGGVSVVPTRPQAGTLRLVRVIDYAATYGPGHSGDGATPTVTVASATWPPGSRVWIAGISLRWVDGAPGPTPTPGETDFFGRCTMSVAFGGQTNVGQTDVQRGGTWESLPGSPWPIPGAWRWDDVWTHRPTLDVPPTQWRGTTVKEPTWNASLKAWSGGFEVTGRGGCEIRVTCHRMTATLTAIVDAWIL
jgi:hypothetical protein